MKWVAWLLTWLSICPGLAFGATEMAITVDDLPAHGALPPGTTRLAIAERMIAVLKQRAIYFDDWAWSDPYARCVARGDEQAIAWLKESFMRRRGAAGPDRACCPTGSSGGRASTSSCCMGAFDALMLDDLLRVSADPH